LSGTLLSMHGMAGLAGWQWLFLLEGLPAVALGLVVLRVLDERPDDATWLGDDERAAIATVLREDEARQRQETTGGALRNRRTWLLAVVYFMMPVTNYGIGFWLPQMLKSATGAGNFVVGLLAAIPYSVGAVAMIVVGRHSDRTGERRWHVAVCGIVCASALVATTLSAGAVWTIATLSIATAAVVSMFGPFWALATSEAGGVGAAASIALVNSVGNTGGFVGPYLLGAISDATHSFAAGLYAIAAMLVAGAALALRVHE